MKQLVLFQRIFAGIGLLTAGGGIWMAVNQSRFIAAATQVEGSVIELSVDEVYYPIYTYEFPPGQKQVVRSSSGSNPPSYSVGEKVKVYVDPAKPMSGEIAGFMNLWFGPLFMGAFGLIFGSIGFGMMASSARKNRLREFLLRNGEKVTAEITEVALNTSLTVNGRNPYRVHAQYRKGSEIHLFESENLWFDPKPYLERETVEVYCMPNRYKDHWMDLRFLPTLANA